MFGGTAARTAAGASSPSSSSASGAGCSACTSAGPAAAAPPRWPRTQPALSSSSASQTMIARDAVVLEYRRMCRLRLGYLERFHPPAVIFEHDEWALFFARRVHRHGELRQTFHL